ncbi:hypothetical protein E2C01_058098 [Portunus trituberculatus]|uniref:Uncharacterized protein n=1 Tax=Portunus trituberculatus TaxID=210409 RepID=A0A5B7H230_PORTR|nr:hypothetical protein [Portunus trituberculatus]
MCYQERREKESDKIKNLLSEISEAEGLFVEVEESVKLWTYEEGKSGPVKLKLKSQVVAEAILWRAWKLKNYNETKMIYIK